jgi:hypothetical protein
MGGLHPTDVRASLAALRISRGFSPSNVDVVVDSASVVSISEAKNGASFFACRDVRCAAGLTLGENADAALSSVDMMIVDLFRIIFFLIFFGGLNDYYLLDLSASQVADEQVLLTQDMIGLKIYPLRAWSCFKKIIIR